jgi:hypothetical protein
MLVSFNFIFCWRLKMKKEKYYYFFGIKEKISHDSNKLPEIEFELITSIMEIKKLDIQINDAIIQTSQILKSIEKKEWFNIFDFDYEIGQNLHFLKLRTKISQGTLHLFKTDYQISKQEIKNIILLASKDETFYKLLQKSKI